MTPNGHKRPITRHRDHLACVECRKKKLKCDRAAPCSACTRRNGGASCSYQRSTTGFEAERDRRKKAEGRLEHLEQLVQQLSKSDSQPGSLSNGTERSPISGGVPSDGSSAVHAGVVTGVHADSNMVYNGATHWSAMLEDIEELRFAISMSTTGSAPGPTALDAQKGPSLDDSSIIFGAGPILTFEQVLTQYLPSRQEADRLVATYFRSKAVKAPFLHLSQFQRLYEAFWTAPFATPVLWTSIMFSVFHASATSLGPSAASTNNYATAAAHCLAIDKHHRPGQYAVEALLLYAQTKCFTQVDVSADIGSILGMVTRAAFRMGYHRDPSRLSISPFEKEMRRRVWSALLQLELLISFQLGLPSSILPGSHDTAIPANLQDADFDEDCTELPPARPYTEETDIMFYIAKHRLSTIFEKIHQHVSTIHNVNMDAEQPVDALDGEMRQTYLSLPPQYRRKAVSESTFDSPTLIIARFCVNMIYEKCLCVLHRPYVAVGRKESLLACYTTSRNMIRHFNDAYDEFQPGGQVEMQRWFMSAITWHDFLLAATALCLVICSASRHAMLPEIDVQGSIGLLERAKVVLAKHSAQSRDTYQVEKIVDTMVQRFGQLAGQIRNGTLNTSYLTHALPGGSPDAPGGDAPNAALGVPSAEDFDWTTGLYQQPMIDESWNWLEQALADDTFFENESTPL